MSTITIILLALAVILNTMTIMTESAKTRNYMRQLNNVLKQLEQHMTRLKYFPPKIDNVKDKDIAKWLKALRSEEMRQNNDHI